MGWDGRSKDALPRMDWYPQDYLADRKTRNMTLEEHGAYMLLLQTEWLDGPLPTDLDELADALCVDRETFDRIWRRVGKCFDLAGDTLINRRLEREREKALSFREERRTAGRKGGKAKAVSSRAKAELKQSSGEALAKASPSPSPSPSPSTSPSKKKQHAPTAHSDKSEITSEFEADFWPGVPNKTGKGAARVAYAKARKTAGKEAIVKGLEKFRAYEDGRRSRDGYTPLLPSTWLNQERWADEIGTGKSSNPAPPIQIADVPAGHPAHMRSRGGWQANGKQFYLYPDGRLEEKRGEKRITVETLRWRSSENGEAEWMRDRDSAERKGDER